MEQSHKILLYGNCQLSPIGKWLTKFDHLTISKPSTFGFVHKEPAPWHDYVFYANIVQKNYRFLDILKNFDYILFQDVLNEKRYITAKEIYEYKCKAKKICLPNFHFDSYLKTKQEQLKDLNNLKEREFNYQKKYAHSIVMHDFVEAKYQKLLLVKAEKEPNHPTSHYYKELLTRIHNKLPELKLNIEDKNIPKTPHGPIDKEFHKKVIHT